MGRWAILNGVLVVIALLLGLEIARTWQRALPPVEIGARAADPPTKGDGSGDGKAGDAKGGNGRRGGKRANEKPVVQPATLVATIVDKDLFDPSRQKATEEVKAPLPKEAPPPPGLTLVGTRILGDRDSEAFITDASQANQQRRLRIGDEVGGYTVKSILPSRVTLASATGDRITLNLAVDKSAATGTPGKPGTPPRPGQPAAAHAASPAAGIQPPPPGAGIQPPRPARPGMPAARPQGPGAPPAAPGTPPPSPAAGNFGAPRGVGAPPVPAGSPPPNPNIPAAVREKLEQLKGN